MATKFQFETKRRKCPLCGSSDGFSQLKGMTGKGKCHSCNQFIPPDSGNTLFMSDEVTKKAIEVKTIDNETVKKTIGKGNNFTQYLVNLFGKELAGKTVANWDIGTSKDGLTVFWYRDKDLSYRQPKIMDYFISGKRNREHKPFNPEGFRTADGYQACIFGEWQLNLSHTYKRPPLIMVESYKNAILGSIYFPDLIFIGGSGTNGFTDWKLEQVKHLIKDHPIIICFDCDKAGREAAQNLADRLIWHPNTKIYDIDPERSDGWDIGDLIEQKVLTGKEPQDGYDISN